MSLPTAALLVTTLAAMVAQPQQAAQPPDGQQAPLVYGCDFEVASRGVPDGWYPTYTDSLPETSESVIFGWDEDVHYSGTHSISIELARDFPRLSEIAYNWLLTPVLEPDTTYRISFWWKGRERGTAGFVYVDCDDRDNPDEPRSASYLPPVALGGKLKYDGNGWKQYTVDLQTPSRLTCTRVRLGLATPHNSGRKIYFDDFRITRLPHERDRRKRVRT